MKRTLWLGLVAIALCSVLSACRFATSPHGTPIRVAQALSGDTIETLSTTGLIADNQTVRLLGIDAPEAEQSPWGSASQRRLQTLVAGKTVRLEFDIEKTDEHGHRLAYVWVDHHFVNEQLVTEGHALAAPRSPNMARDRRLARAQEKARLLGVGLWNAEQPLRVTPDEFRARQTGNGKRNER